jgi:hypothetical protein
VKRRDIGVRGRRASAGGVVRSAAAVTLLLAATALAGCSASVASAARGTQTATAPPASSASSIPTARPAPSRTSTPRPRPKPKPRKRVPRVLPVAPRNDGSLPQTQAFPSTEDTSFRNAVHDFWLAVTTGKADLAKPAFFPETAYEQVKAIADPDYDWQYRLWYEFTLDLAAVRPLIGPHARLLAVDVPVQYAVWVPPGACYNNIGYWHVPGARVVYEQGGTTRSFGIASFISWRGVWYLIHLGALTRAAAVGVVDDPEDGPGIPGPPGGC